MKKYIHLLSGDILLLSLSQEGQNHSHSTKAIKVLLFILGRMALLVTLFLVLVNIFNSVTANAPKSEGLTAVETWVVMCILHVFCVLSEYAIILKIIQLDKQETKRINQVRNNSFLCAFQNI